MSRYRAALYHLVINLIVFALLLGVVLTFWYPDYFFAIDGGFQGLKIVMGVDLVLGPLLTLVVFKSGKPGLRADLSLIGTLQAVCLLAGVYVLYLERTLFFVYYEGAFYTANADTFERYGVKPGDPSRFVTQGPAIVKVQLPDNPIEEADLRRVLYQDEIPLWIYEPLYAPLDSRELSVGGFTVDELEERDPGGRLEGWLERYGGVAADYTFIPIHARFRQTALGVHRKSAKIVDIIDLNPTPEASG